MWHVIITLILFVRVFHYVTCIDTSIFEYSPLFAGHFLPSIPYNFTAPKEVTIGNNNTINSQYYQPPPAKFVIVIPYTKSFLLENPATNRSIQSWKEYAALHDYELRLVDATPIVKAHGQAIITSVEKRHGFVYVTAKPLLALYMFRKLSSEFVTQLNTWMVFADMDTMVANPHYRLEDVVRYANGLGQPLPKRPFQATEAIYTNMYNNLSSFSEDLSSNSTHKSPYIPSSLTQQQKDRLQRQQMRNSRHGANRAQYMCHMIGQMGPSTINSGFLFFPFTETAHAILQDWAQQTQVHSVRNEDWQADQGILQSLFLQHATQVLLREYYHKYPHLLEEENSNSNQNHDIATSESSRKLSTAKLPAHVNHKTLRDHQMYRERQGEKLKQQYHQNQAKLRDSKQENKHNHDNGNADNGKEKETDTSIWSMLFGGNKPSLTSTRNNNNKQKDHNQNYQKINHHHHNNQDNHPQNPPPKPVLPHGSCIAKAGNLERGRCFGRTLRDLGVYGDNSRFLPFCLLGSQSSLGIFNVHDWPIDQQLIEHTEEDSRRYSVTVHMPALPVPLPDSQIPCQRLHPPFYHGKNASIIQHIPLYSELPVSASSSWVAVYQQMLKDTQRTDRQRVSPKTTMVKRTECDVYWKHFLVRHIDSWDTTTNKHDKNKNYNNRNSKIKNN